MSSVEQSTEIAADADELSMSRSASNSQSAVGIGTISGRAIMAVGELALRGIETMTIARTLQRITGRVRGSVQEAVTVRDVQDLLELQRFVGQSRFCFAVLNARVCTGLVYIPILFVASPGRSSTYF